MLPSQKYKNKKIAIYGMGMTGISAAKTFKKLNAKVYCWDDNKKTRTKLKKKNLNLNKFWLQKEFIDKIVISPGIDINKCKIKNYLKRNLAKVITDIDLFFELNKNQLIISITGTNGKSTTCKLIEKILKTAKLNVKTLGNIGKPILSSNLEKRRKKCIYILEVSSYQLQYSKIFRSRHAAILNISPDHLERHKNTTDYTKVKSRIFFAQNKSDYSYINIDNKYSALIKKVIKLKKVKSKLICVTKKNSSYLLNEIKNKYFNNNGNIENLSFAYRIAKNLKIKNNTIIKAINDFKGLPHRQEIIFSNKKLIYINDSKATSFDASLQSLMNYNRIYWIVGGVPKYKDKFNLKSVKKRIVKAYVIGKSTSSFVKKIKKDIPYKISKNIKEALKNINQDIILNKDIRSSVLLSPAGASFDQYNNFGERGNHFKSLVSKEFIRKFNV